MAESPPSVSGGVGGPGHVTRPGASGPSVTPPGTQEWFEDKISSHLSGSPMSGDSIAATFVREGFRTGIDPRFMAAIATAESSNGQNMPAGSNNPFGLGPGRRYVSIETAIRALASTLSSALYYGRKTIPSIQARYAPGGASNDPTGLNNNWVRNVSAAYGSMGGDATKPVIGITMEEFRQRAGNPSDVTGGIPGLPGLGPDASIGDLANPLNWLGGIVDPILRYFSGAGIRILAALAGLLLAGLGVFLLVKGSD